MDAVIVAIIVGLVVVILTIWLTPLLTQVNPVPKLGGTSASTKVGS